MSAPKRKWNNCLFSFNKHFIAHINKRQAPKINAAVPVHTPLDFTRVRLISHWIAFRGGRGLFKCSRGGENGRGRGEGLEEKEKEREREKNKNSHQPLQCTKLHPFYPLPQPSHLLLDPRLRLFDLELLPLGLLSDAALLEVQIELDAGLGAADLVAQTGIEFRQIISQSFMRRQSGRYIGGIEGQEFGTQFGEVDFLGVGAAVGFYGFAEDSTRLDAEAATTGAGVRDGRDFGGVCTFAQHHGSR